MNFDNASEMISEIDPKNTDKTPARCTECDREMTHYNVFLTPINEQKIICWECLEREEKGFNAKRGFRREARHGDIPR